jgi:hypothetical protein
MERTPSIYPYTTAKPQITLNTHLVSFGEKAFLELLLSLGVGKDLPAIVVLRKNPK